MRYTFALIATLCLLVIVGCGGDSSDPIPGSDNTSNLDCEELGYPCSLAETSPAVLEAAEAIMNEAMDQRDIGTMADVLTWLQANPAVVEAEGDLRAIRFRIEGSPPFWLFDDTGLNVEPDPLVNPGGSVGDKAIVGEDTNDDGGIDNRDSKRALVLAPFFWQFTPNEESPIFADQLEGLRGYGGNVTFKSNPQPLDQNIAVADYFSWADYDLIYLSTHGQRVQSGAGTKSHVVVSTGVIWDFSLIRDVSFGGMVALAHYNGQGEISPRFWSLGVTPDFFRNIYPEGLDDTLLLLSACETGNVAGGELAEAMGGENFVMFGWSESVDTDDAVDAMGVLMDNLMEGLPTETALQAVDDAGLRSVQNSDNITTRLERFVTGAGDLRIIELPQLLDGSGDVLTDGTDLSNLVDGIVGDGNSDLLTMIVEVDGVTEADKEQFTLRYFFGDANIPGTFGLESAIQMGDFRYRATHLVDLDFDVQAGEAQRLQVVADLPEGGESTFTVDVGLTEGSGGGHECNPYRPTEVNGSLNGEWLTPESQGSVDFSSPQDPGGGYWTVNLTCDLPAVPRLHVTSGSESGHIYTQTNFGEPDPQSVSGIIEAGPSTGFTATAIEDSGALEDDHPINWNISYSFTSVVDCYEPNQTIAEAKLLPLNIENVEAYMIGAYRGGNYVEYPGLDDWYRLEVPSAGQLTVDLTQSPSDTRIRLWIFNEAEEQVTSASGNHVGALTSLTQALEPGVYFLWAEAAQVTGGGTNPDTTDIHDRLVTPYLLNIMFE